MTPDELNATITDNRGLVWLVITKHFAKVRDKEPLEADGLVGLWKAARTWDGVSCAWTTHAWRCVRSMIIDGLRREGPGRGKVPRLQLSRLPRVKPTVADALQEEPWVAAQAEDFRRLCERRAGRNACLVRVLLGYALQKDTTAELGCCAGSASYRMIELRSRLREALGDRETV